jgi:hypothetical protein
MGIVNPTAEIHVLDSGLINQQSGKIRDRQAPDRVLTKSISCSRGRSRMLIFSSWQRYQLLTAPLVPVLDKLVSGRNDGGSPHLAGRVALTLISPQPRESAEHLRFAPAGEVQICVAPNINNIDIRHPNRLLAGVRIERAPKPPTAELGYVVIHCCIPCVDNAGRPAISHIWRGGTSSLNWTTVWLAEFSSLAWLPRLWQRSVGRTPGPFGWIGLRCGAVNRRIDHGWVHGGPARTAPRDQLRFGEKTSPVRPATPDLGL